MSVHQTDNGRWFVAYREPGGRAVRRKYFPRGSEGKIAAKMWEADLLAKAGKPSPPAPERPTLTFMELAQKYLDTKPLAENTRKNIGFSLNLHIMPKWGKKPVATLTMADLAEVDQAMVALGRSLATRNRARSYCRAICQWGEDNELIPANPFRRFRAETSKEGKAPDLITEDELSAIHQAAAPHLQWAITVMLETGVRPGPSELLAMRMSDVDYEAGGVWLARGKTNSSRALLPLRPEFLGRLKALAKTEPDRQWIIQYEGRQVGSLKTAWFWAIKRAGIKRRLRLYDLRH